MSQLNIRPATEQDIDLILHFVRELAIYEKAEDEAKATPEHVRRTLFCEQPAVFGLICEVDGKAVGFAVYFFNYSTWQGQHGLYLKTSTSLPMHAATARARRCCSDWPRSPSTRTAAALNGAALTGTHHP